MAHQVKDVKVKATGALPAGALTSYSTGIDLGLGDVLADFEVKITAPALAVGQLADTTTVKYSLEMDTDSAFGSPTTLYGDLITQTGAGGAGAAEATATVRVPVDVEPYLRLKMVKTGAADASGASGTLELLF
ncbi:MAG: hypothetical protein JXL80_18190 [Planctomycetes bacterium]|nr:hypothetical protein [Planctomycetota bacterium]